jgi:hypothetical protein
MYLLGSNQGQIDIDAGNSSFYESPARNFRFPPPFREIMKYPAGSEQS